MDTKNLGFTFDLIQGKSSIIKVIGVGGGGNNAVAHMFEKGIQGVDFIVCNTDGQTLQNSPIGTKIQLGVSSNEGLGAGSDPDVGEKAALESIEEIKASLGSNTKMLFITAGMGGGTGTGAAPVVAKIAREMGILTVAIVTAPFKSEGKRRLEQAKVGLEKLKANVDSIIVVNNDKLIELYPDFSFKDAFSKADEVLSDAAKGMAELITGYFYVNVDFRDAKSVLQNSGSALMTIGVGSGENRAADAINNALDSPLLNENNIRGANKVLLLLRGGEDDVKIKEYEYIMEHVKKHANSNTDIDVDVISGIGTDEKLGEALSVLVIATGFSSENEIQLGNINKKPHILEEEKLPTTLEKPMILNEPEKTEFVLDSDLKAPSFEFPIEETSKTKNPSFDFSSTTFVEEKVEESKINVSEELEIRTQSHFNAKDAEDLFPLEEKQPKNSQISSNIGTLFTFDTLENTQEEPTNKVVFSNFEEKKVEEIPLTNNFSLEEPKEEPIFQREDTPKEDILPLEPPMTQFVETTSEEEITEEEPKKIEENQGFPKSEENNIILQRREKLKDFNSRYKKTDEQYDFENIPAFIRQNKKLN